MASGGAASTEETDVVVVGAGLAGLTAARRLAEEGLQVRVVEARDRVGGRMFSRTLPDGSVLDLGAQWIGPGQRRMYALARELGVETIPTYTGGDVFYRFSDITRRGGETPPFPPHAILDVGQLKWRLDRLARRVPADKPWAAPDAAALDSDTFDAWLRRSSFTKRGQAFWRALVDGGTCVEAAEYSLLSVLWQVSTIGDLVRFATAEQSHFVGGAGRLAEKLAGTLTRRVHLSTPVRRIEQNESGVRVMGDSGEWRARAVVVAVPPTLAGRILYRPPVPALRDQITQRLGQGAVFKCLCVYEEAFWRRDGLSGEVVGDEGPVPLTLDGSPPSGEPGVLVAFVSAQHARRLGETLPAERRRTVLGALAGYFGERVEHPVAYAEHDWGADEWSRGGYGMATPTGVLSRLGPALAAPVGRVFWAGSETATEWRNYMEGAVQSGERAAAEVSAYLRR